MGAKVLGKRSEGTLPSVSPIGCVENKAKGRFTGSPKERDLLCQDPSMLSEFDRAVRFFVLNRITFSGVVDSGGYSQAAYEKRFTLSSIDRFEMIAPYLSGIKITNKDYTNALFDSGDDVFIFLDPPYWRATESKLYGTRGALHTAFNHERFAENMKKCQHKWLITYTDKAPQQKETNYSSKIIKKYTQSTSY